MGAQFLQLCSDNMGLHSLIFAGTIYYKGQEPAIWECPPPLRLYPKHGTLLYHISWIFCSAAVKGRAIKQFEKWVHVLYFVRIGLGALTLAK
jgi:hypothetical protein